MDNTAPSEPAVEALTQRPALRVFGVGDAGINVVGRLIAEGLPPSACVAVNADAQRLAGCAAQEKVLLETPLLRGLGSGGDPERGRALAEEHTEKLKALCQNQNVVFVIAGLGGGAGSGISPVVAQLAMDAGAMVLCFATLPFDCEGTRRRYAAEEALDELREVAEAVICLPSQKVFGLIDENTSVLEAFKLTDGLLADCALGVWRLIHHPGLLEIRLSDICELFREERTECVFAVAEAVGPTRSREVMDKLLSHPLLDGGATLTASEAVLVSLMGGPDLTMTEIDRIMQELKEKCAGSQLHMGAAINESFRDRLLVTVIASRQKQEQEEKEPGPRGGAEELNRQLLTGTSARPGSRFVPPPPTLAPDQVQQMFAQGGAHRSRTRKTAPRFRQTQLPLEIVSKGRFDKSEPTIHKGEDLDVPTYIRRGISLN